MKHERMVPLFRWVMKRWFETHTHPPEPDQLESEMTVERLHSGDLPADLRDDLREWRRSTRPARLAMATRYAATESQEWLKTLVHANFREPVIRKILAPVAKGATRGQPPKGDQREPGEHLELRSEPSSMERPR